MGEVVIKTYATLKKYVDLLKNRDIQLLCIIGHGGLGKSSYIEECLRYQDYGYITSHATPLQIYKIAYENRNKLLLFDDVAGLTLHNDCLALLRQIADTRPVNTVQWNTTSKRLGDVPPSFTTTSQICIIANYIKAINPIVASLMDRGVLVNFQPTLDELFNYATLHICNNAHPQHKEFIIQRLKEITPFCKNISLRLISACIKMYGKLSEDEFQDFVFQQAEISQEAQDFLKVIKLSEKEALQRWKEQNYPERTFYHYKRLSIENSLLKSKN